MPEYAPSTSVAHPSRAQVDAWLTGLGSHIGENTPSVEELRASVSWRVTAPLRAIRARERLARVRSGHLPVGLGTLSDVSSLSASRAALHQRLNQIAPHLLGPGTPVGPGEPSLEVLLGLLCRAALADETLAKLWLLVVGVSGCFPDHALLLGLSRDAHGLSDREGAARVLQHCGVWTARFRSNLREIEVVDDRVVAFVNLTGRFGFNSGVQRVTRETLARWYPSGDVQLAVLTEDNTGLRALGRSEIERVIDWDQSKSDDVSELDDDDFPLVVPWNTTFFMPEIVSGHGALTLGALARFTPTRSVAIVYDTIPASSGFSVPRLENHRFTTYLSMLKYFDEAIAISASAAEEFDGFRSALAAQGLAGPVVTSTLLPIEHIPAEAHAGDEASDDLPMILSVGSNEPRKNQIAVVYAAEMLWRQGKQFRLLIVGGRGDTGLTQIGDAATALQSAGRPIEVIRDISESRLADAYSRARFSVFVSFHEGYGLPVAESLAVGTPVIATDYGSTAEIAEGGGCILVDPRDDDALTEAMGRLLDDDTLLATLHEQIEDRHDTSWDDYAREIRNVVFVSKGALK